MKTPISSTVIEEQSAFRFDFKSTVYSHGWVALEPFEWDSVSEELSRTQKLSSGAVVRLYVQSRGNIDAPRMQIRIVSPTPLSDHEKQEVRQGIRRMLRLDEDLSEFYALARQKASPALQIRPGSGRMLRCPTLFEDIVCTLCTTNIAWSGTKRMVASLVEELGGAFPAEPDRRAFPRPEEIAAADVDFLKRKVRLGYRSDYIWGLAKGVADGEISLDPLEDPEITTEDLRARLLSIRGVGAYAAATILMLLGRYEELAVDTEMRAFVSDRYFQGERAPDDQIHAIYAPWGRWRYLAYWFDSTEA